jgi:N-acetyl-alpha-D-muramate 1-phosphate uridylyltransferase
MKAKIPQGTRAMIFAAGLGTRLKPFTNEHPKALAPVNGKSLLQRNIEYLSSFGIHEIIVNVHHFADQIIDFLHQHQNFGSDIVISHEVEEPLETGGGLKKAGWFFLESRLPFIVMNVDILTNLDLVKFYEYHLLKKSLATLAYTNRKTSRNFLFDEKDLLCGWENNQAGEQKISRQHKPLHPGAFTCVHIIDPFMLPMIEQEGKFSIIDTYLDLARNNKIFGYDHSSDIIVDVGKPESIETAEKLFL